MKPRFTDPLAARQDQPLTGQNLPGPCASPQISEIQLAGGMRLDKWRKIVGISKATAWRWRKEGKLTVVWRYGIPWVTAETIENFFKDDGSAPRPACCLKEKGHGRLCRSESLHIAGY